MGPGVPGLRPGNLPTYQHTWLQPQAREKSETSLVFAVWLMLFLDSDWLLSLLTQWQRFLGWKETVSIHFIRGF